MNRSTKNCVVACILDNRDRVLLTRRSIPPFFNQWVMPGGKIAPGETEHQALHREVLEEVGLTIAIDEKIGVYTIDACGPDRQSYRIIYYRSHPESDRMIPNPDEVAEAAWVSAERLVEYDMPTGTRTILDQLFPNHGIGRAHVFMEEKVINE